MSNGFRAWSSWQHFGDDDSEWDAFTFNRAAWDNLFSVWIRADNGFDNNINLIDPATGQVAFISTRHEPRFKADADGIPRTVPDYYVSGNWIIPVADFQTTEFATDITRRIDKLARFIGVTPGDRNMPYFAGSSNGSANALVAAERAEYLNLLDQYDYEKSAGSDPWRAPLTEHEFFMVLRNGPAAQSAFIARAGQRATPEDNKQWRIANGITPEALWGAGEQTAYSGAANAWERNLWQSQQQDDSGILGLGPVGDLIAGAAIGYFTGGMLGPIWDSIGSSAIETGAAAETISAGAAEAFMPAWAEVDAGLVNAYTTGGGLQVATTAGEIARVMQSLTPTPTQNPIIPDFPTPPAYTPPDISAIDVFTEVDQGLVNAYATGGGVQTGATVPGLLSTLTGNAGAIKTGAGMVASLMTGGKSNPAATPHNIGSTGAAVDNSGGFADSLQTLSPALTFGAALLAAVLLVRRKNNG